MEKTTNFISEYSPALESTDHITINERYNLFINGKFVAPSSGEYFDTINPATGKKLSEVAGANSEDVDKAVSAAQDSYENIWVADIRVR